MTFSSDFKQLLYKTAATMTNCQALYDAQVYTKSSSDEADAGPISHQHRQYLRGVFCCRANMLYELMPAAAAATAAMLVVSSSFISR